MAPKHESTRLRIDNVKANLVSTWTCTPAAVTALQELLLGKSEVPARKENVRTKAQPPARRAAGTARTNADAKNESAAMLSPRDKRILATEIANTTLKNLSDALKSSSNMAASKSPPPPKPAPSDQVRKPARSRAAHAKSASISQRSLKDRSASQTSNSPQRPAIRRSSSYSSFLTTGPDAGLISTAECARVAFAYLGTLEDTKVLGKDSQELHLENGILALVGKLVALGLDGLAVKEMRHLKRRLDKYLGHDNPAQRPESRVAGKAPQQAALGEKESLALLLDFGPVTPESLALPVVVNLQTYALRVIANLARPRIIEATWDHLKLSNPSSPANLIPQTATTPTAQVKAARQLEGLARTILSLCPHVSSTHDDKPLQPAPETVLLLQQLAFKVRKKWWKLAKHQGCEKQELVEPFTKCLAAFSRRSQLSPTKKYKLAATLYEDLREEHHGLDAAAGSITAVNEILSSLAQAAGQPEEAIRWLGAPQSTPSPTASLDRQSARMVRIATVVIEAFIQDETTSGLEEAARNALQALGGSLNGPSSDLDTLFVEVNALRRAATRLLMAHPATSEQDKKRDDITEQAIHVIAACVHFSARLVSARPQQDPDAKSQQRHAARMTMLSKCTKSSIDSVLMCCKYTVNSEQRWRELDVMLQDCSHVIHRLEEEYASNRNIDLIEPELSEALLVKLSNAYWVVYLQLKKAELSSATVVAAMQRSINLIQARQNGVRAGGHLTVKLEQLGDTLESLGSVEKSRKAFTQCIHAYFESGISQNLAEAAENKPIQEVFRDGGSLSNLDRVLKSHHHSFFKFGLSKKELAFFDDFELQTGARGVLLEWQLNLYSRTLSKNRHWDSSLKSSITILVERLRELYVAEQYPIRRLRLLVCLLQFPLDHMEVSPILFLESDVSRTSLVDISGSQDEGLVRFSLHLKTLCKLRLSTRQAKPQVSLIRECFSTWESILTASSSWQSFANHIDDVESWLSELKTTVEYLNVKGEEYLALPVLTFMVKTAELKRTSDPSELITSLCAQGLQYLRLGYTGKAGLSFAKAETLISRQKPSTEARLQWHIAYAEYLARIGNTSKGLAILSAAQKHALADQNFMDMAKPSTTLSSMLRFNRVLADATYVYSLLSAMEGSYKDAAKHARQCVTLNRRIWATLESRVIVRQATPVDGSELDVDGPSKAAFDPLSSMRNDKGAPIVMSVTHDALSGSEFWSVVPALYRGLMQHSQVFAHQGLLHEAIYVAEQAEKVASASRSPSLMIDNASWRADCWAQSGRPDKAQPILESLVAHRSRKCLSIIAYQSAVARTHHWTGHFEEEVASYATLDQILQDLTSPVYIRHLDTFSSEVDNLVEQMSHMTVDSIETQPDKATTVTRGCEPITRATKAPVRRTTAKSAASAQTRVNTTRTVKAGPPSKKVKSSATQTLEASSSSSEQCSILYNFKLELTNRRVLAHLSQEDLATATTLIAQIDEGEGAVTRDLSRSWAAFKTLLAQSTKQIAENIAVNTLPESTIAFPAINSKERRLSEDITKRPALATSTTKAGRGKKLAKDDFTETLQSARDRLVEAHAACAVNGPNYMFQQISMALSTITVLLSAVSGGELGGSIHPLYAAFMGEVPKCNALRLIQESVEAEKEPMSREECLRWPSSLAPSYVPAAVSEFQKEYIDIIPETWTAISLALNDSHDELLITRFESGISPFLLRLPLARHASRDMDEEEFSFEDGKRDFDEIIELSDFSTRTTQDMTSREARQQWWAEREALNTRLHELLINIENIWLGGFKGIFSQHERQASLLARFRKSFENILNQHLPSRRKKTTQKRPTLDTRVLELFIGLGNANDEELDLDEALMDLIYFVVDILHFNGERNAYDEIDFDAMVVETQEALQAYHSAAHQAAETTQHTILILDNNLHRFPWESLPCLEKLSISRLPSLAALRERLLSARQCTDQTHQLPGHYIRAGNGGTSILNPSRDLSHTSKTLKPHLDKLLGPWTHIANRAPTEKEFEDSLREKDMVLYFGHGSGAQFVRSKSVRSLYPGRQNDDSRRPGCATTFLFGCSSAHLTENGIYEPSGMLASYLTAGAPAVVGMLWDVTDKDCDRFAVKAGELWGLWPEPQEDDAPVAPPKTPGRKTKGKSRVAQLVDEVEGGKAPGSAKKGKKAKMASDEVEFARNRRRGFGLDECVREARKSCVLRYLNGAAAVVYGIPVYLE